VRRPGHKLPLLRDVDSSYYLRQEKNGFNLGPYERNCKAHWVTPTIPMPEDFSFQLYPDDLDRLEWYIEDAMARVPLLARRRGLARSSTGRSPMRPTAFPLIGPMPGVPNAFEACVFTFGIAQGGGAGKVLAEWITEGETEWDMWSCDPRRFTDTPITTIACQGHGGLRPRIRDAFPAPLARRARPEASVAVHDQLWKELGGQMGAYAGWERANWFAKTGDDTSEEATETWNRSRSVGAAHPRGMRSGARSCRRAGPARFSRFDIEGPGAADWLLGRIAGGLPGPGRMNLAYFPDDRGRILTEMSRDEPRSKITSR
jgi:dimethylglycine dehydrogenase